MKKLILSGLLLSCVLCYCQQPLYNAKSARNLALGHDMLDRARISILQTMEKTNDN